EREPGHDDDGGAERPPRRAQRPQLDPLRAQDAREGDVADPAALRRRRGGLVAARRGGDRRAHALFPSRSVAVMSSERYSTASAVSDMYASSSVEATGVSSCSTMRDAAASSPTATAVLPRTSSRPGSTP